MMEFVFFFEIGQAIANLTRNQILSSKMTIKSLRIIHSTHKINIKNNEEEIKRARFVI